MSEEIALNKFIYLLVILNIKTRGPYFIEIH